MALNLIYFIFLINSKYLYIDMYGIYYIVGSAVLNITLASIFVIISVFIFTKIKLIFLDHIAKILWVLFIASFVCNFLHGANYIYHLTELLDNFGDFIWRRSDVNTAIYLFFGMFVDLVFYFFGYELYLLRLLLES